VSDPLANTGGLQAELRQERERREHLQRRVAVLIDERDRAWREVDKARAAGMHLKRLLEATG
jgi:hypothetical protein